MAVSPILRFRASRLRPVAANSITVGDPQGVGPGRTGRRSKSAAPAGEDRRGGSPCGGCRPRLGFHTRRRARSSHRQDADALVLRLPAWPRVPRGTVNVAYTVNLMPTLPDLLGRPIPADTDRRILPEVRTCQTLPDGTMVGEGGVEPPRDHRPLGILSPVRLPVPPLARASRCCSDTTAAPPC